MNALKFNISLPKRGNKWGINAQGFDASGNQWMIDGREAVVDPSNARRVSTEGTLTNWPKLAEGGFGEPMAIDASISWEVINGYHAAIAVLAIGNGSIIAIQSDEESARELPVEKQVDMIGTIM